MYTMLVLVIALITYDNPSNIVERNAHMSSVVVLYCTSGCFDI